MVHEQPQFLVSHPSFKAKIVSYPSFKAEKTLIKPWRPKCVFFWGGLQVKRKKTMAVVPFYGVSRRRQPLGWPIPIEKRPGVVNGYYDNPVIIGYWTFFGYYVIIGQ